MEVTITRSSSQKPSLKPPICPLSSLVGCVRLVPKGAGGRTCLLGPQSRTYNISTVFPLPPWVLSRRGPSGPWSHSRRRGKGRPYVNKLPPCLSFQNLEAGAVHPEEGWNALLSWVAAHTLRAQHDLALRLVL